MNTLPVDFEERVYAGVLGKIIGVYLGRPFEGWHNQKIEDELGEIHYYVHEKRGVPLVVADDDISGTFTFLRALPDHGTGFAITAEQIGQTWLNYLVEKRTVLWWGGLGVSTEHTAYLRLKNGIPAPESGSIERNGKVVAEQIGAQIFIDGWAMVCPGDPEKAVRLARKAASVSHDGEAIYGAQVIAALEAQAFVEPDMQNLLDTACTFIPRASVIYQLIEDIRAWKEEHPLDWRTTFRKIEDKYGYDKYGGGCHMIPNHAVIILALLYGADDFGQSLMIANTAGWDTDCNSANVGCIMGIKNGLDGINRGVDFRSPVADRMYLPTADGGRCITDAVRETYEIVNIARSLQRMKALRPNHGMRFHFNLPGALQGFQEEDSPEARGVLQIENCTSQEAITNGAADERMLALHYTHVSSGRVARAATATFLPPEAMKATGYGMAACPTLYSGQTIRARISADDSNQRNAHVRLYVRVYGKDDLLETLKGDVRYFAPGDSTHIHWEVPDTQGQPIAEVGVEVGGHSGTGTVYLDWLDWNGTPHTVLGKPPCGGTAWRKAWVNAADDFREGRTQAGFDYHLVQNEGIGQVLQGVTDCWLDYTVATTAAPHLAKSFGLLACAHGLRRHVALRLSSNDNMVRLIWKLDEDEDLIAEAPFVVAPDETCPLSLTTHRDGLLIAHVGSGDRTILLRGHIPPERACGAVGLLVEEGSVQFGSVRVMPAAE